MNLGSQKKGAGGEAQVALLWKVKKNPDSVAACSAWSKVILELLGISRGGGNAPLLRFLRK